eukprot:scaffold2043_cov166-Amphora_coffeaeformis.AAC.4
MLWAYTRRHVGAAAARRTDGSSAVWGTKRCWLRTTPPLLSRRQRRRRRELQASNNVGGLLVGLVTFVSGTGSAVVMAYMEPPKEES